MNFLDHMCFAKAFPTSRGLALNSFGIISPEADIVFVSGG